MPLMRAGGALVLPAVLMLGGCEPADTDPGPGGVTVGEARALDEAASMLDEQRLPETALDDLGEEAPGVETAAPGAAEPAPGL